MQDQFASGAILLDNALAYWVHRVYQASRNRMFRVFHDEGVEITPEQWIVLVRLWESDGRTQTELGDATYRDRPTMSRILDLMEKRELVERRASATNARIWHVHLTRQGKALQRRLVPRAEKLVKEMVRGIPPKDLEVTRATLRKLFENMAVEIEADAAGE